MQQQIPPRFPLEQRSRAELRFYRHYGLCQAAARLRVGYTTLKSRVLLFHNIAAAEKELKIVSYFRIANYLRSFEVQGQPYVFLPNSYFEDALKIYYLDKQLRALIFTAIQRSR